VIEWPTTEWLTKEHPLIPWHVVAGNFEFGLHWIAYAISWGHVLAEWDDAENFAVLRPAYPIPFGRLSGAIEWSLKRGKVAQRELIGMTAKAEIDFSYLASLTTAARSGTITDQALAPATTFETADK
jgi:hypothetical protein